MINTDFNSYPSAPIPYNSWNAGATEFFMQEPLIKGSLRSPYYSYSNGNSYAQNQAYDPTSLIMGILPAFSDLAGTQFNTFINDSDSNTAFADADVSASAISNGSISSPTFLTMTKTPTNASSSVRGSYVVGINGTAFENAVQAFETSNATNGIDQINTQSGNVSVGNPESTVTITGGSGISTSGNNGSDTITITATHPIYKTFTGDSGSTVASTTTDSLNIEGDDGVTTTATTDKVTIALDSHPYKTVQADTGSCTSDFNADTLKVTNITTDVVPKAAIEISAADGTPDELRFNVVPQAHAGFGAQIVKVIEPNGISSMNGMNYAKYIITAYEYNGDATMSEISGNKELRDFGLNSFNVTGSDPYVHSNPGKYICQDGQENGDDCNVSLAVLQYAGYKTNDVVLAQRIGASVWVTAGFPPTKAVCL